MLQASKKSSGVAAGQSEVTCHKHALSWKIFYLWTKTQISKNKKKFRLAPSLLDTGAKCPWASGTTYWFFWSCWFLLSGSLLSSQQMGPSRSWRFMPDREHLFSLDPSIVVAQHGTSSIAGMHQHASWCQCLVVLGKTMLDQKLADEQPACWCTGTELAWMASTSLCKFAGKAMALL